MLNKITIQRLGVLQLTEVPYTERLLNGEHPVACSARRCETIPNRLGSASMPHTLADQATGYLLFGRS